MHLPTSRPLTSHSVLSALYCNHTCLPAGDQITHQLELDEEIDREIRRDVFKEDPEYDEHEKQWQVGL